MSREPRPWWWKARKRWAVQINGRRYVEPTGVARDDLVGMAQWWEALKDQFATDPAALGERGFRLGDLCRQYLAWDARRIASGKRDKDSHDRFSTKLKRICRTRIPGGRLGTLPVHRLSHRHYEASVDAWVRDCAPGYARALAASLRLVVAWGAKPASGPILRSNPLAGVALPPEPMIEERYAERSEAAAWLRWLWRQPGVSRTYVLLQRVLIHTGARPSEWTRADCAELDVREWVLIRRAWKAAGKKRRARRVFVPTRLRRSLQRALAGREPASPIFPTPRGKRWRPNMLANTTADLRRAAIAAGVPIKDVGPDRLTNYRWRHTAASSLLMAGVPISDVAALLGTSVRVIESTYGHLLSRHLAQTAERLAAPRKA